MVRKGTKEIVIILTCVLGFVLAGCGSSGQENMTAAMAESVVAGDAEQNDGEAGASSEAAKADDASGMEASGTEDANGVETTETDVMAGTEAIESTTSMEATENVPSTEAAESGAMAGSAGAANPTETLGGSSNTAFSIPVMNPVMEPNAAMALPGKAILGDVSYVKQCELDYVYEPSWREREEALEWLTALSKQFPKFGYVVEHESEYPDAILGTVANNPEMADFAYGYATRNKIVTGGMTEEELEEDYPLFLQWDIRWGYYPYGNTVMGDSGCGPTCLSMAIFALTRNEEVTPDEVADYSMKHGYYVDDVGTAWALMNDYPALYGLHSYSVYRSEREMKARLDEGDILILSMRKGHFTSGGHFIVIYDYDEEGFKVNDPRCIYRSRLSWPYSVIRNEIKNIWTIGEGIILPPVEENVGIEPPVTESEASEAENKDEDDEDEDDEDEEVKEDEEEDEDTAEDDDEEAEADDGDVSEDEAEDDSGHDEEAAEE